MDLIFGLVRKLVTVAIFAGFAELLLPSGKFRSFVRFGIGLVVIAMMLQPLASLRGLNLDPDGLFGDDNQMTLAAGGKEWVEEQTRELVEAQLAAEILRHLGGEYAGWGAEVKLDVEFDGQGFLKNFAGMAVDLYPPGEAGGSVAPVIIGERVESGDSAPPVGLADKLAQLLGIPAEKLDLRFWGRR